MTGFGERVLRGEVGPWELDNALAEMELPLQGDPQPHEDVTCECDHCEVWNNELSRRTGELFESRPECNS